MSEDETPQGGTPIDGVQGTDGTGERADNGLAATLVAKESGDDPLGVNGYEVYSTDEDEGLGVVSESGFGPDQQPTAAESRLLKGRKFHSWQEFDNALDEYEASSGTVVRRIYRSKTVFTGRCRGWSKDNPDTCKMELCARLMKKTGLVTIRRVHLIHSCVKDIHKWRNGRNRARWVARKVMRIVKVNRDTTIEQLQSDLREYHMADSKQWSVQRARMACREKLGGGQRESFSQIPAYATQLKAADPGVHVIWGVSAAGERFEKIFVAPSSSQRAFQYSRPTVGLDGTHTSGDYPMIVLLATSRDGENNVVTLAWAIVPVESSENWAWFLRELKSCYPGMDECATVFISDRDKGLKSAVGALFPSHHHAFCVQHIKANIKQITDLDCVAYFDKVVAAKTRVEFEDLLNEFEPQSEKQSALVPYIRKIDPALYARHAFPSPRFGHIASDVTEVVNAAIRPNRKLPALLLCHEIWLYCMESHFKRMQHADGLPTEELSLTNFATEMLTKLTVESASVRERTSSLDQGLMVDRYGSYALRVAERHCDCMDWQEMQFPCAHLITFEKDKGRDVRRHAGKYWLASNYKSTYSIPVPPISIDRLDRDDRACGEPHIDPELKKLQTRKKQQQQQQQQRLSSKTRAGAGAGAGREGGTGDAVQHHDHDKEDRTSRKQNQKCSGCKKPGHNLRRCPFATIPQPPTIPRTATREEQGEPAQESQEITFMEEAAAGEAGGAGREGRGGGLEGKDAKRIVGPGPDPGASSSADDQLAMEDSTTTAMVTEETTPQQLKTATTASPLLTYAEWWPHRNGGHVDGDDSGSKQDTIPANGDQGEASDKAAV